MVLVFLLLDSVVVMFVVVVESREEVVESREEIVESREEVAKILYCCHCSSSLSRTLSFVSCS